MTFVSIGLFACGTSLFAQPSDGLHGRSAKDYLPSVEDKSFLQQQRIHIMKKELNDYSERLYLLRNRFETLFYGQTKDDVHNRPFDASTPPQKREKPQAQFEPSLPLPPPPPVSRIRPSQLAYEIDGQDTSAESPDLDDLRQPLDTQDKPAEFSYPENSENQDSVAIAVVESLPSRRGYFIIRPGITFPHKKKEKSYPNYPGKSKRREYDTGFSILASGGFILPSGLHLGGGAFYRENDHDTRGSYQKWPNLTNYYHSGSKSYSAGGFVEFGYTHSIHDEWKLIGDIGLGYGVSVTDKFIGRDLEDFIFAMVGLGVEWSPFDSFGLNLGCRYLYEDEVPAFVLEAGFKGTF